MTGMRSERRQVSGKGRRAALLFGLVLLGAAASWLPACRDDGGVDETMEELRDEAGDTKDEIRDEVDDAT
jgi:hypothetical protein